MGLGVSGAAKKTIPYICRFWCATTLCRPAKSTPKSASATKQLTWAKTGQIFLHLCQEVRWLKKSIQPPVVAVMSNISYEKDFLCCFLLHSSLGGLFFYSKLDTSLSCYTSQSEGTPSIQYQLFHNVYQEFSKFSLLMIDNSRRVD